MFIFKDLTKNDFYWDGSIQNILNGVAALMFYIISTFSCMEIKAEIWTSDKSQSVCKAGYH